MGDIIAVITTYAIWPVTPILLLVVWFWFVRATVFSIGDAKAFERSCAWLREDSLSASYFWLLGVLLDGLARWIGDADRLTRDTASLSARFKKPLSGNPWTSESYKLCLLLAVIYPVFGLLGYWLWSGGRGALDDWMLLPPVDPWRRLVILAGLVFISYGLWSYSRAEGRRSRGWWLVASAFVGAVVIVGSVALFGGGAGAVLIAVLVAVVVAGSVALVGGGAGAVGAVADAVLIAVVVVVALAVADAIGAVVVVAIAVVASRAHMTYLSGRSGLPQLLLWLIIGGVVLAAFRLIPAIGNLQNPIDEIFLILIVLVPLANAPLDWFSLGVTRGLLHAIRDRTHGPGVTIICAVADVVLALIFLVLVSAATVGAIALANRMAVDGGGTAIVDLGPLLTGIREAPSDPTYYWIYLMLLTTVVPTVLHAYVAALAFVNWAGQAPMLGTWRAQASADLDQDIHQRWAAATYLSLVPVAALVLAGGLVCGLLWVLSNETVLGTLVGSLLRLTDVIES